MATVTLTNVFVAGTPAVATQVNTNFTDITDQVNGNLDADNYADNSVTDAKLRTSAAYSIVGRAGATAGNVADITATSANTVLQRGASGLEFATIGDASVATGIDAAKIADGSVSNTEFQYLNGVTSNIQTQLDRKCYGGVVTDATTTSPTLTGPSGWSVSKLGAGTYRVTHGLGTSISLSNYSVVATVFHSDGSSTDELMYSVKIVTFASTWFEVCVYKGTSSSIVNFDENFSFVLVPIN